jgi:hypothetical protein
MPKSKGRRKPKRRGPAPPPVSSAPKESPRWYVILMFSVMAIGLLVIVLNYIGVFGDFQRPLLWTGLGLIGVGFVMTLNYH